LLSLTESQALQACGQESAFADDRTTMADSRHKASKEPEPALECREGYPRPTSAPKRKVIPGRLL